MPSEAPTRKHVVRIARLAAVVGLSLLAAAASAQPAAGGAKKVLQLPIRSDGPKSLDPVKGSTQYDNACCSNIYETLIQFKYLARPMELEPLLLTEMPTSVDNPDGTRTWHFKLKDGIRFQDDPCFPGGKGREMVTDDVFYTFRRVADPANDLENWWLLKNSIVGFDEYKDAQAAAVKAGKAFDYSAPVAGFKKISDKEFEIVLRQPVYRFMNILTEFQLSIVPREAVEMYKERFNVHPVGSGPFTMTEGDWKPGSKIAFNRNPNYHEAFYPSELPKDPKLAEADRALGLDTAAGKRLPFLDRLEITFYIQDPPMWLDFNSGNLAYTQVPAEQFDNAFIKRTKQLREEYIKKGVVSHADQLLDFIYWGFNMEDPVVGGYTEEKKALRKAICLAFDLDALNKSFYNDTNTVYDGPIPPGMDGYPEDGEAPVSNRGPDIQQAKELLAKAGYPGGKDKNGNQLVIEYYSYRGGNNDQQVQAETRFLDSVGLKLNAHILDFSELDEAIKKKRAPVFGLAWGSDYPDAENNLALFYGPNAAPSANSFNYKNSEFDALYEKALVMTPGPERTALYEKMRDMTIEDAVFIGSQGRTRFWLVNPWLKNCKPTEVFNNWMKYLDVDDSKR